MALNAFASNPSIAGFGPSSKLSSLLNPSSSSSSSSSPPSPQSESDSFGQIVKEIVDNAVDACRDTNASDKANSKPHNVVVLIDEDEADPEYLRLTVTDDGSGMDDISFCVNPFSSTKAIKPQSFSSYYFSSSRSSRSSSSRSSPSEEEGNPKSQSGRYGIGLTLAILHSYLNSHTPTIITTTKLGSTTLLSGTFQPNTDNDTIDRVSSSTSYSNPLISGTSISLLLPFTTTTDYTRCFPRLAEYFARFHLIPSTNLSIEVRAPTLSSLPLYVKQLTGTVDGVRNYLNFGGLEEGCVGEFHVVIIEGAFTVDVCVAVNCGEEDDDEDDEDDEDGGEEKEDGGDDEDDADADYEGDGNAQTQTQTQIGGDGRIASMQLVRLFNNAPIMDCADAKACALVSTLPNLQAWRSFNLKVRTSEERSLLALLPPHMPLFDVTDYADSGKKLSQHQQHSGSKGVFNILPVGIRLRNIFCFVHIRANQQSFPLPTLSKSRLPNGDVRIEQALNKGVHECLKQIARNTEGLLFSSNETKRLLRDGRDVEAVGDSLASIILGSKNKGWRERCMEKVGCLGVFDEEEERRNENRMGGEDEDKERGGEEELVADAESNILSSKLKLIIRRAIESAEEYKKQMNRKKYKKKKKGGGGRKVGADSDEEKYEGEEEEEEEGDFSQGSSQSDSYSQATFASTFEW